MSNYYGRIISGIYKGKKIILPNIATVRPTTDRVKEIIFNVLQHNFLANLKGNVLDAFSGSGALAIECLSRGCGGAVLVEKDKEAVKIIAKNLTSLFNYSEIANKIKLVNSGIMEIRPMGVPLINLLFLDAPYGSGLVEDSFNYLNKLNLIGENCCVVVLADKLISLPGVKNIITKSTAKTKIQFYQ